MPLTSSFSTIAWIAGAFLGVAAIFKFKDHVDNPMQHPLSAGVKRMIAGGMFLSLPFTIKAVNGSLFGTAGAGTGQVKVDGFNTAHGAPTDLRGMIEGWSPRVAARVQAMANAGLGDGPGTYALADVQLRTPLRNPSNLLCIAANYKAHADEMGRDSAVDPDNEEPVFFAKSPRNCVADPGAPSELQVMALDLEGLMVSAGSAC